MTFSQTERAFGWIAGVVAVPYLIIWLISLVSGYDGDVDWWLKAAVWYLLSKVSFLEAESSERKGA